MEESKTEHLLLNYNLRLLNPYKTICESVEWAQVNEKRDSLAKETATIKLLENRPATGCYNEVFRLLN